MLRIHSLIALSVALSRSALHVGRQRQFAGFTHQRFKIACIKLHLKKAIIATDNFCVMLARDHDARSRFGRMTG